jgi:DNA-binding winged helix-turn-helix (wHTH) protein
VRRYRFADFTLSPRRRVLLRGGDELPLIPRYFDLLVVLVEQRHQAVHRREIFDRVWTDAIVSDSALSQAIRTIRRTLGDDSREPRFIRTISRHGYRFVYAPVIEEEDEGDSPAPAASSTVPPAVGASGDPFAPLLPAIARRPVTPAEEEAAREAAELLHALGTDEALRRLEALPHQPYARALMRDTRWESAVAGVVPILGGPAPIATTLELTRLRLRRASKILAVRGAGASIGAATAGAAGGAVGGLLLTIAPGSQASPVIAAVLAVLGGCCGLVAGIGVAAGLSVAEAVSRSHRAIAAACGAAAGGGVVGLLTQWLGRWTLATLVGVHVDVGGAVEGVVLGGAAGIGFAAATSRVAGDLAAPRGRQRVRLTAIVAATCGVGALALTLAGRPLVGGTIHMIAEASRGAEASLAPLGRFVGEPGFGPLSRALIGIGEGGLFGAGLALGLTRISRNAH